MKHIIKKVSAFAMAAVLLGAGGAAAANINSANSNTITASAANGYPASRYDGHAHGQYLKCGYENVVYGGYVYIYYVRRCRACGEIYDRTLIQSHHI
ncbi:MAG: hypothetical protein IJK30_13580 [Ruminococcus sp.]|nr:hypothetical protein [Ruminococcus sp.]